MKDSINVHSYSAYGSPSGVTAGAFVPGTVPVGVNLCDRDPCTTLRGS